ncbi:hypothetical protein AB5I41_19310 [Sphingomonas sp. MMS24-JH45]
MPNPTRRHRRQSRARPPLPERNRGAARHAAGAAADITRRVARAADEVAGTIAGRAGGARGGASRTSPAVERTASVPISCASAPPRAWGPAAAGERSLPAGLPSARVAVSSEPSPLPPAAPLARTRPLRRSMLRSAATSPLARREARVVVVTPSRARSRA